MGQFKKGNTAAKGKLKPEVFKIAKHTAKEGVGRAIIDLFEKPYSTLKEELSRPDATRFEYVFAKAIALNNTKFITWAIEWVGGKALQMSINKSTNIPVREVTRPDGTVVRYQITDPDLDELDAKAIE